MILQIQLTVLLMNDSSADGETSGDSVGTDTNTPNDGDGNSETTDTDVSTTTEDGGSISE